MHYVNNTTLVERSAFEFQKPLFHLFGSFQTHILLHGTFIHQMGRLIKCFPVLSLPFIKLTIGWLTLFVGYFQCNTLLLLLCKYFLACMFLQRMIYLIWKGSEATCFLRLVALRLERAVINRGMTYSIRLLLCVTQH